MDKTDRIMPGIQPWFDKVCSSKNFKLAHIAFDEVFPGDKDENFESIAAFFYAAGVADDGAD